VKKGETTAFSQESKQSLSRAGNAGSPLRIVAILAAALEYAAGERAIVIMTASPSLGIVPDARRAVEGTPVGSTCLVIGKNLRPEVGAVPFESLPGVLSGLVEDAVERRGGHNAAARAAAVARVDEGELISRCAHESLQGCRPRYAVQGVPIR